MAESNNKINDNDNNNQSSDTTIPVRVPKKILHFSDGTLEVYSEDEEDSSNPETEEPEVDTSKLTWGPWFAHKAYKGGKSTLRACDQAGEALAWFLGITTPKFQLEYEEYKRIKAEEQRQKELAKGWTDSADENEVTWKQPSQSENLPLSNLP